MSALIDVTVPAMYESFLIDTVRQAMIQIETRKLPAFAVDEKRPGWTRITVEQMHYKPLAALVSTGVADTNTAAAPAF